MLTIRDRYIKNNFLKRFKFLKLCSGQTHSTSVAG